MKNVKTKQEKPVYKSFLYLAPEQVTAAEMSKQLDFLAPEAIEIWTEVNLLELATNSGTLTFEDITKNLRKEDHALLEELGAKRIYACDYNQADAKEVQKIMTKLLEKCGGRLASDTEDFQPFVKVNEIS